MYSEEKLVRAMNELLDRVDFNTITVTELCKMSGVSRPTFYHHFTSLASLAFKALLGRVEIAFSDPDSFDSWLKDFPSLLEYIKENPKAICNMKNLPLHNEAVTYLRRLILKSIKRQEILLNYRLSAINEELIAKIYAEMYLALVSEYVKSDMTLDIHLLDTQRKAMLDDGIDNAIRSFMRLER